MSWFNWFRRRPSTQQAPQQIGASTAFVGGRLRTRGIPYTLPHDLDESNRLDFQHHLLRSVLRGNFAAPIDHPRAILDVGTGTGRWAIELAQHFPQAQVIGLDVNVPMVDEKASASGEQLPSNYRFVAGNVLEGLPFPDQSFDFVHMRLLFAAIPHDRWRQVVAELARVTRPGGWVESVEFTEMEVVEGEAPGLNQVHNWSLTVNAKRGVQLIDAAHVAEYMDAAGLVHISGGRLLLPSGNGGGRRGREAQVGAMVATDYLTATRGFCGLVVAQGMATQDEVEDVLRRYDQELKARHIKAVLPVHIAYGQRPI